MKMQLLSLSTIITVYLFSLGKASKPNLRRHLNSANEIEGTPILRVAEGGEGNKWVIESFAQDEPSGTPLVYEVDGLRQSFFTRNGIVSGQDLITVSDATKSTDTISVAPGAAVTITPGGSDERRRRLATKTGTLSVLVVRVSTPNSAEDPERTGVQLASDCFGIGAPDTVQMVSRFDACSGGKLKLIPAANTSNTIINGVVDVTIPITATGQVRRMLTLS
jgi:hypothetical protein